MGIALSATVRLFSPLSVAMAHWLRPSAPPSIAGYRVALPPASLVPASCDSRGTRQAERLNPHPAHSLRRPLRVVRIVDTGLIASMWFTSGGMGARARLKHRPRRGSKRDGVRRKGI